jgi:hypothetical protein
MAALVETARIRAPCAAVFDYRADVGNLPRYNPDVSDLLPVPGESALYRFRVRLGPGVRVPCRLRVVESDRPRRIRFAIESVLRADEVCTFEDADGDTLVRFEANLAAPAPISWLAVALARRQIRAELALMKQQLEERT